jgi:hypothetical protein
VARYPHCSIEAGELGVICEQTEDVIAVRLDKQHDGLEEWFNAVHWYRSDDTITEVCEDLERVAVKLYHDERPESPNDTTVFLSCAKCAHEIAHDVKEKGFEILKDYSRLEVGITKSGGMQVWCLRHDINVSKISSVRPDDLDYGDETQNLADRVIHREEELWSDEQGRAMDVIFAISIGRVKEATSHLDVVAGEVSQKIHDSGLFNEGQDHQLALNALMIALLNQVEHERSGMPLH